MARTGPVTKDTTTVALGLAQIRIGQSAANITKIFPVLTASDSIGALANTSFTGNAEFYRLESGFPMLEDAVFPLRESAMMECAFREFTPFNFAVARGIDPNNASFPNWVNTSDPHVGRIALGTLSAPSSIRMEAIYTYPDATNTMNFIFPRAQVSAAVEAEFAAEEASAVSIQIEAKRADSEVSGGNAAWDDKPLGWIVWNDGSTLTTTTTTTSTTTTTA